LPLPWQEVLMLFNGEDMVFIPGNTAMQPVIFGCLLLSRSNCKQTASEAVIRGKI